MKPIEVKMFVQPYIRPDSDDRYYIGWLDAFPAEGIEGADEDWIGEQLLLLAARKYLSPIAIINEAIVAPLLPPDDGFVGEGFPIAYGPGWDA